MNSPAMPVQAEAADLFELRPVDERRYHLQGELSFASVDMALQKTQDCFAAPGRLVFDLAGVDKADSAGMAVLLEWLRLANRAGVELHYLNLPRQLMAMARVAGVDGILTQ